MRIFLDFETYYDRGYSLRKMSPVEYILSPQWETLACAVAIEHEDPFVLPRDEIADFLRGIKKPYAVITHNALFDACVLAYRYDIHPTQLFCTLSMARAVLYHEIPNGRLSLANVLKHLNLPQKTDFIIQMMGKHYHDLEADPGLLMGFMGYAVNDVEGCRSIFFRLRESFPEREALVMDRVIRMATQPKLELDLQMLSDYRDSVVRHKWGLLNSVARDSAELMSNPKFAALLEWYGVTPPTKISPTTGRSTWAFAKTDQGLIDLLEHDDPDVQALVAARLGVKTTIEETRSGRFIAIGTATFHHMGATLIPVPLKYSGAHTHRYSGDWKLNMQNLGARKSKELRKCIVAPDGYMIVAIDAAQIEARLTAWLSLERPLVESFRSGEDVYRNFAAEIFGVAPDQIGREERFVGKTCILGLGFGMSAQKLHRTIVMLARDQGIDIIITEEDCGRWVHTYRNRFRRIWQTWGELSNLITDMAMGQAEGAEFGPCKIEGTTVILPSGLRLYYNNLRKENGEYIYNYGSFTKRIYGGKLLENVVQALDRQHVVEAGLRTEARAREAGITDPRVLLNVHDENVYCVPIPEALTLRAIALEEMARTPKWGRINGLALPLAAEAKWGSNYGELRGE